MVLGPVGIEAVALVKMLDEVKGMVNDSVTVVLSVSEELLRDRYVSINV